MYVAPYRPRHLALLAGLSVLLLLTQACAPGAPSVMRHSEVLPPFELPTLDGEMVSSESLRGDIVVLNFWATWCGPCVAEVPALKALADGSDARVVSITIDDPEDDPVVRRFVERHQLNYPVLRGDIELARRYGVCSIPYTVVLDRDLRVMKVYRGKVRQQTLEKRVARLAAKS